MTETIVNVTKGKTSKSDKKGTFKFNYYPISMSYRCSDRFSFYFRSILGCPLIKLTTTTSNIHGDYFKDMKILPHVRVNP